MPFGGVMEPFCDMSVCFWRLEGPFEKMGGILFWVGPYENPVCAAVTGAGLVHTAQCILHTAQFTPHRYVVPIRPSPIPCSRRLTPQQ